MKNKLFPMLFVLAAATAWCQGRAPEKKPAPPESHPVRDAKDGANQALDGVDHGIHAAVKTVKDGGNEALGAVDRGVHKVVGPHDSK